jgi:hypothetical protein
MDRSLRMRLALLALLFVALIGLGLVMASFYRATSRITTLVLPPDITVCERDHDCILIDQISCCACESGGAQGAVNRQRRPDLKAFLQRGCGKRIPCVEIAGCRTDLRAVCEHRQCTVAVWTREG